MGERLPAAWLGSASGVLLDSRRAAEGTSSASLRVRSCLRVALRTGSSRRA